MLAVIETNGKQYHVKVGDVLKLDKIPGNVGDVIDIGNVLMLHDIAEKSETKVCDAFTKDAKVKGEVLEQTKDKKILVFKKKRRHNYRRKKGHRQHVTFLRITEIIGK
ncbi:MAG: large subunit ribosomal protein L21 [Candidatus Midichloriaceae bacterium]|jgi:large subunit ribosomal protein L21